MTDINVSSKTAKQAREYKIKPDQLAFADLVAVGWEPLDAWNVAIRKGAAWNRSALEQEVGDLLSNDGVKTRIGETKATLRKDQIDSIKNADKKDRQALLSAATSKEDMLVDLQSALMQMAIGSQEWRDTKKMIIDVSRMKQEEIKTEDTTIHYYLPVNYPSSCDDCLLNPNNKRPQKKSENA
jgi:uncharacterized protein YdaT